MADAADRELAYALISYLETLGAQWTQLQAAVEPHPEARGPLNAFGQQFAEMEAVIRDAAGHLCPECKSPMAHFEADPKATAPAIWVCTHITCDRCEPDESKAVE